jgi:hypothetical protein
MPSLLGLLTRRTQRQRLAASGSVRQFGGSDAFDFDTATRTDRYAMNRAMLKNTAYRLEASGGFRETILKETFNLDSADDTPLVGAYNPVRTIVDAYQNVFRGTFGQDIKIDEKVDERDVNPKLTDPKDNPLRNLWKWSLLDTHKSILQEWAANFGTVGLRIVARDNTDPAQRRVSIQLDHPSVIKDFNEDDRGNVTEIELEYQVMSGNIGEKREPVTVHEVLTKERFIKTVDDKNVLDADQQKNALGVCPYVLLRHRDDGNEFGRWAYDGSEEIIHWLNWIITNQGESVRAHAWPEWFAAAGGPKPTEFPIGRRKVAYVQQEKDTPTPIFEPLVPALDQGGALAFWSELITRLHDRQPELVLSSTKVLSGQSGETIAKLQIAGEAAILRARAQYEDALKRALQIGLSQGVLLSLWDIGTGMGSVEQADNAFRTGLEDFAFAERPALPPTPFDQVMQANAETARRTKDTADAKAQTGILDQQTILEDTMRMSPEKAQEVLRRKRGADSVPTTAL